MHLRVTYCTVCVRISLRAYRVTDPVTVMHPFIVTFTDIAKFIIRFIINQ